MHPIVERALSLYRHESGMTGHPNNVMDNDNPILGYAVFAELCRLKFGTVPEAVKEWGKIALDVTRVSPGYWHRSTLPRHAESLNSHDNYAAICVLEPLGVAPVATEICERGELTGYHFDNVHHDRLSLKAMRQLGDVAQYKICAGRIPNLVELLWMFLGFLNLAIRKRSFEHHLAFARLSGLRIMLAKKLHDKMWFHVCIVMMLCIWMYDLSLYFRYGSRFNAVIKYYHDKEHPNVLLAKELEADGKSRV